MSARPVIGTKFSWFLLIAANILWAGSYVASKLVLRELSVTMMLALRFGLSALLLFPWLLLHRKDLHLTRQDILQLGVLMLVGFGISKFLQFGGLALTTASDVALLIGSESLFTAALSWVLLKERLKGKAIVALLLGFFGIYLLIERGLLPLLPAGGGLWRIVGDLLVMLGVASESFSTVCGKALLTNKRSPLLITTAALVGSALFWLPIGAWEVVVTGWHPLSLTAWFWLGWLVVVATVICYLAWFQGLARVDGSAAAATLFIQPLLGPIFAVVLLHDQLTPITVVGGLLIIASVSIISRA
jgi:drug/metabolite transporter (DMT)-like permease